MKPLLKTVCLDKSAQRFLTLKAEAKLYYYILQVCSNNNNSILEKRMSTLFALVLIKEVWCIFWNIGELNN